MLTDKEEISRELWHLHCGLDTQAEAEKIIFPIIDSMIQKAANAAEQKYLNLSWSVLSKI